jgi:hypothetical protein
MADGNEDVIGNAVNLGYRVIEEHLLQGRRAAERLREGSYNSTDMEEDVRTVVDRVMRVTREAAVAWLDLLAAPTLARTPPGMARPGRLISVEVQSTRRAQVTLDFNPASYSFVPLVQALHPTAPGPRAAIDVSFMVSGDDARCVLTITVSDDVPPGTYTGVVLDSTTLEPGGTLCVRILS